MKNNWDIGFSDFYEQKAFLKTISLNYVEEIERAVNSNVSIVEKSILYRNLVYSKALEYKSKYDDTWLFVYMEDMKNTNKECLKKY